MFCPEEPGFSSPPEEPSSKVAANGFESPEASVRGSAPSSRAGGGSTFSREELLSGAWGFGYEGTARTVDNFVSQLRQKREPDPEAPRHFVTVRGLGYKLDI